MSKEAKTTNKSEYLVEVKDLKQYFPIKVGFMKNYSLKSGGWRILCHQTR